MDAVVALTLIPPFAMTAIECDYCSGCHGALTLIPPFAITAMNAMVLLTLIPHVRCAITAMEYDYCNGCHGAPHSYPPICDDCNAHV